MSQAARIRDFVAILENSRQPVSRERLMDELEISAATFKRDLDLLRDQMHAPIKWVPGQGGRERGYILEDKGWSSGKLGLPKAWFSASEIYALLMIHELASHIGPGLLTEHLQPLITRVTLMLSAAEDTPEDVRARVRLLNSASKRSGSPHFEAVARAAVKRRRLKLLYFTRSRNDRSERVVSPQVIVHYKENWYLVAWCHKADGLRMFALDAIEEAVLMKESAKSVAKKLIEEIVGRDFGIYSGEGRKLAKLLFTANQAPWVRSQTWHKDQVGESTEDGGFLLTVPYSDPRELVLEILRYGPDVRVLEPPELQQEVAKRLRAAADQYA
ncbi:YafY family protein [Rhodoferax sp.]|uniref:helix-turn-helix transcriptional regulator n=1 Tax=Rhodoferax sp. TaxID=50421 RepID=UPI002735174D|nr:transcriptional regulator [Rhodoferax sp.]MDP3190646.1 transcriptional regulator [Rhodoferax sp.]